MTEERSKGYLQWLGTKAQSIEGLDLANGGRGLRYKAKDWLIDPGTTAPIAHCSCHYSSVKSIKDSKALPFVSLSFHFKVQNAEGGVIDRGNWEFAT